MAHVPEFLNYEARKRMTKEEIAAVFSSSATTYEQDLHKATYTGHLRVSQAVISLYDPSERSKVKVLDVAAGTGLLAKELYNAGFTNIDWLDPSDGMKTEAIKKGIYSKYFVEFMDGHRIQSISTDSYDCLAVSGGFNEGLIPCAGIQEMIRVVKPGGSITFAINEKVFNKVDEYRDRLQPLLNSLENTNAWTLISRKRFDHYIEKDDMPGVVMSFRVNVSECSAGDAKTNL